MTTRNLSGRILGSVLLGGFAFCAAAEEPSCPPGCYPLPSQMTVSISVPAKMCMGGGFTVTASDSDYCSNAEPTVAGGPINLYVLVIGDHDDLWAQTTRKGESDSSSTTAGGTLNAPGWYLILARAVDKGACKDDDAYDLAVVEVECCPCQSGQCATTAGSAITFLDSVDVRFALGLGDRGKSAGQLRIYSDTASDQLAKREGLTYYAGGGIIDRGGGAVYDSGGVLLQVMAPEVLADIWTTDDANNYKYEIRYYAASDVHTQSGERPYAPNNGAEALVIWEMSQPKSDPTTLTVRKKVDGDAVADYVYANPSTDEWTLSSYEYQDGEPVLLQTQSVAWTWDGDDSEWVRTELALDSQENEIRHIVTYYDGDEQQGHYGLAAWKRQVVDPSGANLQTTRGYYTDGDYAGLILWQENPDGSWVWSKYESDTPSTGKRRVTVFRGWEDTSRPQSMPSVGTANIDAVRTTYDQYGHAEEQLHYVGATLVGKTTWTNTMSLSLLSCRVERRYASSTGYLQSTTYYDTTDPLNERITQIIYPDGRRDYYDRTPAYGNGPGTYHGDATDPSFTTGAQGLSERVRIRHNGPSGSVADVSTQEFIVTDPNGRTVWTDVEVYTGSWAPISRRTSAYDEVGHETDSYRLEPAGTTQITHASTAWSACCDSRTVTDERGVQTTYLQDMLGRPQKVTKASYGSQLPIVTSYEYGYYSGQTVTTRVGSDSNGTITNELASRKIYDVAGRLVYDQTLDPDDDSVLYETGYDYAFITNGGQVVTVTRPDGEEEVTEYYRDRRPVRAGQVRGQDVIGKYYEYAVNGDGTQWTQVFTGLSTSSPRYVTTTYDWLGRVKQEEGPGWTASGTVTLTTAYTYYTTNGSAGAGQLKKVETSDGTRIVRAATLYEYNALGQMIRSGLDLGGGGTLVNGSRDRISETQTTYPNEDNGRWRVTKQITYGDDGNGNPTSTPITLSQQKERLTGFGTVNGNRITRQSKSLDIRNNVTQTTVVRYASDPIVTETTDYPDTTPQSEAQVVTTNGLVISATSKTGLTTTYGHDGIGRQTVVTDARGNDTTTAYNDAGQVESVTDDLGNATTYTYYGLGDLGAGQAATVTQTLDSVEKVTRYDYDERGRLIHTWGLVPQPTENVYVDADEDGIDEVVRLRTYRGGSAWNATTWAGVTTGDADTTTWTHDSATGLLEQKKYADDSHVDYTYTTEGQLHERKWARLNGQDPLKTTYTYNTDSGVPPVNSGDLIGIDYADDTHDVAYQHNRLGMITQIQDAAGTHALVYDSSSFELSTETFGGGGLYDGKVISHSYASTAVGRLTGLTVGSEYTAGYAYDSATARLSRVTGPGLPYGGTVNGAYYTYGNRVDSTDDSNSDMVRLIEFKGDGQAVASTVRAVEPHRDILAYVENNSGGNPLSKYDYRLDPNGTGSAAADALGRRKSVVRTGDAFTPDHHDDWTYNDRNELTGTRRYNTTDPANNTSEVTLAQRSYSYDSIGNRSQSGEAYMMPLYYCIDNGLNQYDATAVGPDCPTPYVEEFGYDADGNLTGDEAYTYTWDAENRLIQVAPAGTPWSASMKVTFVYDYLGRRVQKDVYVYAGGWPETPNERRRFIWDGWLMLLELDGLNSNAVLRQYTWGLDLAGLNGSPNDRESAGGIGGLLAVHQAYVDRPDPEPDIPAGNYLYFYDGNGNVGQLADPIDAGVVATYEYDAYGNVTASDGDYAFVNPFRFSTKYWDDETRLGYWGYRYYSPSLGRWISRDPIGELGDVNLYGALCNAAPDWIDPNGAQEEPGTQPASQPKRRSYLIPRNVREAIEQAERDTSPTGKEPGKEHGGIIVAPRKGSGLEPRNPVTGTENEINYDTTRESDQYLRGSYHTHTGEGGPFSLGDLRRAVGIPEYISIVSSGDCRYVLKLTDADRAKKCDRDWPPVDKQYWDVYGKCMNALVPDRDKAGEDACKTANQNCLEVAINAVARRCGFDLYKGCGDKKGEPELYNPRPPK